MKLFVVATVALLGLAVAVPIDPNDEVELVRPTNTNNRNRNTNTNTRTTTTNNNNDGGGGVIVRGSSGGSFPSFLFGGGGGPVFVIRTSGGSRPTEEEEDDGSDLGEDDVFHRNGEEEEEEEEEPVQPPRNHIHFNPFGAFPVFSVRRRQEEPTVVEQPTFSYTPERRPATHPFNILRAVLGGEESPAAEDAPCDFLCKVLKGFGLGQDAISEVEAAVEENRKKQQDRQNEVEVLDGDGQPITNSTYTEEVLPDGTIVRKNTTVVQNEDGSGGYFFSQSTSVSSSSHSSDTHTNTQSTSNSNNDQEEEAVVDDAEVVEDPNEQVEVIDVEATPIKLRTRRQAWSQQAEASSPFSNEIPRGSNLPHTLAGDTRVNDIITENGRRGGLVRIDPNSEFIRYDNDGNVVAVETERRGDDDQEEEEEEEERYAFRQQQQSGQLRQQQNVQTGQLRQDDNGQMTLPWQQDQTGQLRHTWQQQPSSRQEIPPPVPSGPVWVGQQQHQPSARQENPPVVPTTWTVQQPSARQEVQPVAPAWTGQLQEDPWAQQAGADPIFTNIG